MKKRLLSLVLMLVLLIAATVFSAQAAEVPSDVEWIEIGDEATFIEWFGGAYNKSKHVTQDYVAGMTRYYRLTDNVTVTTSPVYYLNTSTAQINTYFDLNGYTLTYADPAETGATRFFGSYNTNTTCTMVNGTLKNESAITASNGGLLFFNKGNLVLEDVVIDDMKPYAYASTGKLVTITSPHTATFTNVTFNSDTTQAIGTGGIINCAGTLNMTNCTLNVSKSSSMNYGGVMYIGGGTTTLTDCTFNGGAANYGGAIYCVNAKLILNNTTFDGGHANLEGGNIMQKNGSLTINSGSVIKNGTSDNIGGNLSIANSAKFYLSGGTVENGTAVSGGNIADSIGGGTGPTLNIQSGIISGGSATNGGNIYLATNANYAGLPTLNITGGTITGGSATADGGNVCLVGLSGKLVTMNMSAGTLGGEGAAENSFTGTAKNGGNISATYATVTLSDNALVSNGRATASGGNIIVTNATLNVKDSAEVSYGFSDSTSGNIYASTAGIVNISGGLVTKGSAEGKGGNFYMSSTNTKINITGGTVSDGFTYGNGGNIYHNNGHLTVTGGVISGGEAMGDGGNLYLNMGYGAKAAYCGSATFKDDGDETTPIPQIIGGKSTGGSGGNIYFYAYGNLQETGANKMILGNCVISDGWAQSSGDQVYVAAVAFLEVLPEFAQELPLFIEDAALPTPVWGGVVDAARFSASGAFAGKLILENYGQPYLYNDGTDTCLHIAGAAVIADDTTAWYKDNASAVAAYTEGAVLQAGPGELALNGGEYTVDLAGQTVAFTGSGNVTCFDSANDTYETFGSATFDGVTLANTALTRIQAKDYYLLCTEGTYSFHRVNAQLTSVALRPAEAGIYYSAQWNCDDTVKPLIEAFGIVVSLKDIPGNDFALSDDALWSVFAAEDFDSGIVKTGAMVTGILKDALSGATQERIALNSDYAQMAVFAKAYVTIQGSTYTGIGADLSLYDILKAVSDQLNQYATQAPTVQSFMTHWSGNGLIGEPWDALNFQVSEDVLNLNTLYDGTAAYHGELHDHADTGGTSDGKQPLSVWKEELGRLDMDFATIVDHKQSSHMYLEDWDNAMFIGGSEAATTITDRKGVKLHYNMIFANPQGLENVVSSFSEFGWQYYPEDYTGTNAEKLAGGWHFSYPGFTGERFGEVIDAIYENGGFLSIVHPKSAGYVTTDVAEDAWFRDYTGVEVFYTYHTTRDGWQTQANYGLWTDLLALGKKVYATAGNDEHNMPSNKAVSVIYASERNAQAWVDQLRAGNFTAGGVGIRSAIGDTMMGGTTSFAGKRLTFSVGDFHESLFNPSHTYRVDVVTDAGVVYSQEISCTETFYHAMDADADAAFYYFEIFDVTLDSRIAIGNPIWNADK